ncbi:hypothetical protein GOP47_0020897 [Adiantum capillus-veneris]|uniref:Serine racemase n=1 Tax=Adiantum capillus-veneris TaxID=13818 RepID=A0A9D4UAU4_ADICA|nr:hypothetical protein GOP47_0020897 [Adiantum capillus-veneris]
MQVESIAEEKQGYAASLASIQEARRRISPFAHVTPVLSSSSLNQRARTNLYFKCELFQKGGAFKFRGACNAVLSLPQDLASKGVITHSSGNHAAAIALAAKMHGIPAFVVMPKNAPKCKVENVKRYGGKIYFSEPMLKSREEVALSVQEQTGAALVHPYNDGRIISGQGTISLELLEQIPELDAIIVPISGGGLISGITIAAKAINPNIKIFAAEPEGADDAAQSKAAGKLIITPHTHTIADGLRASLGSLTWPVVRDMVDDVVTVTEEEIVNAIQLCYEILKVVVEPSGAVGLAAVLSTQFQSILSKQIYKHVGIVLSGGNVDLGVLGRLQI